MSSTPVQAFAATGIAILKKIAYYARRPISPLIDSRFFNTENYKIVTPGETVGSRSGNGYIYGVHRTLPAKAFFRTENGKHNYNFQGGKRYTGSVIAYAAQEVLNTASDVGTPADETTAVLETIPFDLTTGVEGWSMDGELMQLFQNVVASHYIAAENAMNSYLLRAITRPHNIKRNFDGENALGVTVDFDTDTGRTPLVQNTDLSRTNTDSPLLMNKSLLAELHKAAQNMFLSGTRFAYVILPLSAFFAYRSVLNQVTTGQQFFPGVETYAAGEGAAPNQGEFYFSCAGFRFVGLPDEFFEIQKYPAITGPDCYKCYILPPSAVNMFFAPATMHDYFSWGDTSLFGSIPVLDMMSQSNQLEPNEYAMLIGNARSDKFLETWLSKDGAMPTNNNLMLYSALRSYIRPCPPGEDPNAMGITYHARLNCCLLRTQPHYIQTWAVPLTKV